MSSFGVIEKGDNNTNGWENKTSGNKEPPWYTNIEQPIRFAKLASNIPYTSELTNLFFVYIVIILIYK
jgi:hypothetical protein